MLESWAEMPKVGKFCFGGSGIRRHFFDEIFFAARGSLFKSSELQNVSRDIFTK